MFNIRSAGCRRYAHLFQLLFLTSFVIPSLLLGGCVSPNAEPFQKYHASLVVLREGAESAIHVDTADSKRKFVDDAVKDPQKTATFVAEHLRLNLANSKDSFSYSGPDQVPVFLQAQQAEQALKSLNDAFVNHAALLSQLAQGKDISPDKFDQMASDINAGAKDFVDSLNVAAKSLGTDGLGIKVPSRDLALVSTVTSELIHQYMVKKQTDALKKAIDQSAADVTKYTASAQTLIVASAEGFRQRYTNHARVVNTRLTSTLTDAERRQAVEDAITLHDDFVGELQTLQALHEAYGKIPAAFTSLKDASGGKPKTMEDIQSLATDARRVIKLYETLSGSGGTN